MLVSTLSQSPYEKAKAMLAKMHLEEKITMLHGTRKNKKKLTPYTGNTPAITRLGIPPLNLNDGPQGFNTGGSTCWPSGLTVGATWDRILARKFGEAMGKEFYDKGANVLLGPGLCLARIPVNGRNFEYTSGEDPFLGNHMVQHIVGGIQSQNVIATAKHYSMNNQETDRELDSAEIDERTRFEMYYPPFEGAIQAGVGSIMCSYNKVNGDWSCENNATLNTDLKESFGFKGWVMSDWYATHSTSINQGLDQEMPNGEWMGQRLLDAVKQGIVTENKIDESVLRILTPMYEYGIFDHAQQWMNTSAYQSDVTSKYHSTLARQISAAGTVLLTNDGLLPFVDGIKKIAVLGKNGKNPLVHGGGSGAVDPTYVISPLEGIQERFKGDVIYDDGSDPEKAAGVAESSDAAIIFISTDWGGEGKDRTNLSFPIDQETLVSQVTKAQPRTVVVCVNPGAVIIPWAKNTAAVLLMFMPGLEMGHSIADILWGDVNPSGRLPLTIPNIENEVQFTKDMFPGVDYVSIYSEKLLVGYRWYDHHKVNPHFAFGHGLSYTKFSYTDLKISGSTITFDVINIGKCAGAEVAQLYLSFPSIAGEPPRQLKGFLKTSVLDVNEVQMIKFDLTDRDLSIWDIEIHTWRKVFGTYIAHIGSSSSDIHFNEPFIIR